MCWDLDEKPTAKQDPVLVAVEVLKFAKGLRGGYRFNTAFRNEYQAK